MSVIKKWVVVTALIATFLSRFTGYQTGSSSSGVCAFVELISIRLHSSSGKAWLGGAEKDHPDVLSQHADKKEPLRGIGAATASR